MMSPARHRAMKRPSMERGMGLESVVSMRPMKG